MDVNLNRDRFPENDIKYLYQNSVSCCFDEIFLGIFDTCNIEYRMFCFFYALGHVHNIYYKILPKYEDLPYIKFDEACAYRTGIKLAAEYGIEFSYPVIEKGISDLKTSFGDNHPEKSPLKYFEQAKGYAFIREIRERKLNSIL